MTCCKCIILSPPAYKSISSYVASEECTSRQAGQVLGLQASGQEIDIVLSTSPSFEPLVQPYG